MQYAVELETSQLQRLRELVVGDLGKPVSKEDKELVHLLNRSHGPGPVLQWWVWGLPLMQQSVLITAVRGADGMSKDDPSKTVTRGLRAMFMRCARPTNPRRTFLITEKDGSLSSKMAEILEDPDAYPHHFLMHLVHAAEILGYKHPEPHVRVLWNSFYLSLVNGLHCHPETREEMDERLSDQLEDP